VTKGLDPGVPMKDSGIPWIGEIPAHWDVRRIATFSTKITNGYVGPTRGLFVEEGEGIPYLQSLHIKDNSIRFEKKYFVPVDWHRAKSKSILRKGDILVVQTGDIGQVASVPAEFEGANCHALIIVATRQEEVRGRYLSWALNSNYGFHALKSIQTGALHPHLNCTFVREVPIPVPPHNEQDALITSIEGIHTKTREVQTRTSLQLERLQEYRQALITAAVTGQLVIPEEAALSILETARQEGTWQVRRKAKEDV
jgi:type I restriction enzyme S subunit